MYRHVIEVEGRFIDNLTNKADGASESISGIGESARKSKKRVDDLGNAKASPDVGLDTSKFTQSMDKVNRILAKFKKVHSAALNLKESGTYQKLKKITDTVEGLTRKTWSVIIRAKDLATAPFRAIRNSLFSLQTLATTIFAGIAANQLVMKPVSLGDSIEQSKIAFETKLGSAAAAESFLQKIYKFDEKSPFDTVQIVGIAQQMMNLGWTAENVLEDLGTIGDWSASLGKGTEGISAVTRALGQMRMKGKLSSEEMLQLTEAGVDAWNYVAKYMGEDITTIREMAEDGAIEVDTAIKAIMAGMGEYTGAAATQADRTVNGLIDQVKSLFQTYVTLPWGEGLGEGLKEGLSMVRDFVDENKDALKSFGETAKEIGQEISAKFADKVKVALDRVNELTDSFEFKNADWKGKVSMLWKGLVADPFKAWLSDLWSSEENIQKATEIGASLARGITNGILAVLGITDIFAETGDEAEKKGSNIAQGFAKGFVENFDVSAISDKFVEAIKNVWGALPWWAKTLIVGYGGSKLALGGMNVISSVAGGIDSIGKFIGSASNMTGLLGFGTKAAINLGAGNLAGGASLGAGALSAIGLGATAGGIASVAGLGHIAKSYYDSEKAYAKGDEITGKAESARATSTLVGLGAGAGIGLGATVLGAKAGGAIGALFGGVGAIPGALIGAGIGTVAGWIGGEKWARNIEAASFESENMQEAIKSGEKSAEELAKEFEKAKFENAAKHFGDISLSMSEIKRLADQIVWGDDLQFFDQYTGAAKTAKTSLESLKSTSESINRWMWKAGLGVVFDEDEKESFIASFNEYINSAKSFVENKHYEFTSSASLLLDLESDEGKSIIEGGNAYYSQITEQLNDLGGKLSSKIQEALEDGVISTEPITLPDGTLQLSEQEEITNLQKQIADITSKLADAESAAELELIKVKFGGGNLDNDSFDSFMSVMETTLNDRVSAADEAFKVQVANLRLRFPDGGEQYTEELGSLIRGYEAKVEGIKAEIQEVQFNIIGEAYKDVLGDDGKAKLTSALEKAVQEGIDSAEFKGLSDEKLAQLLGLDKTAFDGKSETAANLRDYLADVLGQIEIIEVDGQALVKLTQVNAEEGAGEKIKLAVDGEVPDVLDENVRLVISPEGEIVGAVNVTPEDCGVNPPYDAPVLLKLLPEAQYQKISVSGNNFLKSTSITATPTVRIVPKFVEVLENNKYSVGANLKKYLPGATQEYRGGFVGGTSSAIEGFANGGFVRGGARLITVAEEGTPEVIIPLGSQRRQRGLDLWMKAGEMLGVNGFDGGRLATGGRDEGIRHHSYSTSGGSVSNDVHVDMGGVHVSISVDARGGENVVEAIKAQSGEIAEAVAGILADELSGQFENTPTKGGAA